MPDLNDLEFRQADTSEEFDQLVELQRAIWGFGELDVTPPDLLMLHRFLGGVVLAAFEKTSGRAIAFCFSFAGLQDGVQMHWSHMLGVLPEYRGMGLGKLLKWRQREIILANGIRYCRWTFDPLETVNCRLNIVTLGATAFIYKVNVYGTSSGHLHAGLPTDRFVAHWELDSDRVEDAAAGKPWRCGVAPGALPLALRIERRSGRTDAADLRLDLDDEFIAVPIILDMQNYKRSHPESALDWRLGTRTVFQAYFSRGYRVNDVLSPAESSLDHSIYILQRSQ